MSQKRKVSFAEDDTSEFQRPRSIRRTDPSEEHFANVDPVIVRTKEKHSLDSDEEDTVESNDGLRLDDIEGNLLQFSKIGVIEVF